MLQLISPSGVKTELAVEDLQWYVQRFGPLPDGWTVEALQQEESEDG